MLHPKNTKVIPLFIMNSLRSFVVARARNVVSKSVQVVQTANTAQVLARIVEKWNARDGTAITLKRVVNLAGNTTIRSSNYDIF
jgi:hypothetical protein